MKKAVRRKKDFQANLFLHGVTLLSPSSLNSLAKKFNIDYQNNYIYFVKVKPWIYRGDDIERDEKQSFEMVSSLQVAKCIQVSERTGSDGQEYIDPE